MSSILKLRPGEPVKFNCPGLEHSPAIQFSNGSILESYLNQHSHCSVHNHQHQVENLQNQIHFHCHYRHRIL